MEIIDIIDSHLDQFCEEEEIIVFRNKDPLEEENPIAIYWIKPNDEYRPYSILMTCGMSRLPMCVPDGQEENKYLEVVMLLPPDWEFGNPKSWKAEEIWPINHLRSIASIPHNQKTWMGFGHTTSWNRADGCFPGTTFNASILFPSISLPDSFLKIESEIRTIKLLSVIPLYPEELKFKMEHGSSELIDRFNKNEVEEVFDLNRINVCP